MTSTLEHALRRLETVRDGFVVRSLDGRPKTDGEADHAIERICRRAGLPIRYWHTLRHSLGTHAALFGVNPWPAAGLAGPQADRRDDALRARGREPPPRDPSGDPDGGRWRERSRPPRALHAGRAWQPDRSLFQKDKQFWRLKKLGIRYAAPTVLPAFSGDRSGDSPEFSGAHQAASTRSPEDFPWPPMGCEARAPAPGECAPIRSVQSPETCLHVPLALATRCDCSVSSPSHRSSEKQTGKNAACPGSGGEVAGAAGSPRAQGARSGLDRSRPRPGAA